MLKKLGIVVPILVIIVALASVGFGENNAMPTKVTPAFSINGYTIVTDKDAYVRAVIPEKFVGYGIVLNNNIVGDVVKYGDKGLVEFKIPRNYDGKTVTVELTKGSANVPVEIKLNHAPANVERVVAITYRPAGSYEFGKYYTFQIPAYDSKAVDVALLTKDGIVPVKFN